MCLVCLSCSTWMFIFTDLHFHHHVPPTLLLSLLHHHQSPQLPPPHLLCPSLLLHHFPPVVVHAVVVACAWVWVVLPSPLASALGRTPRSLGRPLPQHTQGNMSQEAMSPCFDDGWCHQRVKIVITDAQQAAQSQLKDDSTCSLGSMGFLEVQSGTKTGHACAQQTGFIDLDYTVVYTIWHRQCLQICVHARFKELLRMLLPVPSSSAEIPQIVLALMVLLQVDERLRHSPDSLLSPSNVFFLIKMNGRAVGTYPRPPPSGSWESVRTPQCRHCLGKNETIWFMIWLH